MNDCVTPREAIRNGLRSSYMNVGKLLTTMKNGMTIDEGVKRNTFYKRLFNNKRGITADLWIDVMDALGYDVVLVRRKTGDTLNVLSGDEFEL